jgi:hypothetical protein
VGEAVEKEGKPKEQEKSKEAPMRTQPIPRNGPKVAYHEAVEEIKDVNQALKKGRGRPRKMGKSARKDQETNFPGPGKRSVPNMRVGCCLGPEGNWVSSGEGGKGGPGPPSREEDKQSSHSNEGGIMEQEEEGRQVWRDEEESACTE